MEQGDVARRHEAESKRLGPQACIGKLRRS